MRTPNSFVDMLTDREIYNGTWATNFIEIVIEGVKYFQSLFIANSRETIAIVIKLSSYFLDFVNPEDNQDLMVEVGKEQLLRTLQSFQKDKSLGPNGLPINFSSIVMILSKKT
jgi:hypothetical protein